MHSGHGLPPGGSERTQAMLCRLEGGGFKVVWQRDLPST